MSGILKVNRATYGTVVLSFQSAVPSSCWSELNFSARFDEGDVCVCVFVRTHVPLGLCAGCPTTCSLFTVYHEGDLSIVCTTLYMLHVAKCARVDSLESTNTSLESRGWTVKRPTHFIVSCNHIALSH
ncbi:unnamed protein product [Calicophoron daubneyi]|uniref:Uncharacterized protein n=1 Tax=Calicophoron daubneyi TaxID=300641 RepID=A0AAV2TAY8_CALDB